MKIASHKGATKQRRRWASVTKMVGREGFEPSKAMPTDLQSVAFDRFATCPKPELEVGIEPTTYGLQNRCSTS